MNRAARPGRPSRIDSVRATVDRGRDVAARVKDGVAETRRTRRDPVLVARRRRRAARQRLVTWTVVSALLTAACVALIIRVVSGPFSLSMIALGALAVVLWGYAVVGVAQAAIDLRSRARLVRSLPPPQPDRPAVARALRPDIARLNGYSDALRSSLAAMTGPSHPGRANGVIPGIRDETIAAADAAERRLRQLAADATPLWSGSTGGDHATPARARLTDDLTAGIDAFGRLATAAAEVAGEMSRLPSTGAGVAADLDEPTERLTALAAGMRELTIAPDAQHPTTP